MHPVPHETPTGGPHEAPARGARPDAEAARAHAGPAEEVRGVGHEAARRARGLRLGDVRWEKAVQLVRVGGGGGVVIEPSMTTIGGWVGERERVGGSLCSGGKQRSMQNREYREIDRYV